MTALPPALDRFGAELEIAVRRDLGARRTRRRLLRAAALSAAAVAAALGVLAVLPAGGPSVVERAAAALKASDDTILHYQLSGEQRNPDGSVVTWSSESWQLRAAPYTRRQIEVGPEGVRAETLTGGDTTELYDARTNTIYVASRNELATSQPRPKIKIVPASRLRKIAQDPRADTVFVVGKNGYTVVTTKEGAKRLREELARSGKEPAMADQAIEEPFRAEKNGYTVVTTKEGAKRLREELARSGKEPAMADQAIEEPFRAEKNGYTVVTTKEAAKRLREKLAGSGQEPAVADQSVEEPFRAEILALLESGRARETGRVELGGRDAIRIEAPDRGQVYLVDAETYAPIEWTSAGQGGGVTLRFPVYEELPVDAESMELLDLGAQHPGARVERDPAAYRAVEARLFPHG
jgi:hypothetical protein